MKVIMISLLAFVLLSLIKNDSLALDRAVLLKREPGKLASQLDSFEQNNNRVPAQGLEQKQLQQLLSDLKRLDQSDTQLYASELALWYDQVEKWRLKANQECLSKSSSEQQSCFGPLDQQWEHVGKQYLESRKILLNKLYQQYQQGLGN